MNLINDAHSIRKETVYLGLDVSRHMIHGTAIYPDGRERYERIKNNKGEIRKMVARLLQSGTVHACYEAGDAGTGLARILQANGVECWIVQPLRRSPTGQHKTDSRDSKCLAEQLSSGTLLPIPYLRDSDSEVRILLAQRRDLQRYLLAGRQRLSRRNRDETLDVDPKTGEILPAYDEVGTMIQDTQSRYLEDRLRIHQKLNTYKDHPNYAQGIQILTCFFGIGLQSALAILSGVIDIRHFPSSEQFASWVGFVPRHRSSGGRTRTLGPSHRRDSLVKQHIYLAAARYARRGTRSGPVVQRNCDLPEDLSTLIEDLDAKLVAAAGRLHRAGKPGRVAANAIARRLCQYIWQVLTLASR